MKKVLLLGASGSIGSQSLDIIDKYPNEFDLVGFSVGHNYGVIPPLLSKYPNIKTVYLIDNKVKNEFSHRYPNVTFYSGEKGLADLVDNSDFEMAIDALVGFAGAEPAILTLKKNKILCLANKEALVTAGNIINDLLDKGFGKLYPIDSEHVAIAKCLSKVKREDVEKIILTASGGALRNLSLDEVKNATPEDALNHPTWKMGNKITIDSATMMNKGFEIVEACYLFHFPIEMIEVVMHDESLVHSGLLLKDGSYVIDYGKPDMHNPIEYAMFEGKNKFEVMHINSLDELKDCHFHQYDKRRYPLTELAKTCFELSGSKLVALNAANEIAVQRFLNHDLTYMQMHNIIFKCVSEEELITCPSFRLIKSIDKRVRKEAKKL